MPLKMCNYEHKKKKKETKTFITYIFTYKNNQYTIH